MVILGVSWGDTSTAAVMVDGKVVSCVSEERHNKIKNYDSWPTQAIDSCLDNAGVTPKDISYVAWNWLGTLHVDSFLTRRASQTSVETQIKEQKQFWYPKIYEGKDVDYLKLFWDRLDIQQFPGPEHLKRISEEPTREQRQTLFQSLSPRLPQIQMGIDPARNAFLDHHTSHAYYAACALPSRAKKLLVFTIDGSGDFGINATVSISEDNKLKRIFRTNDFIIGRLYRNCTLLLGMKQYEHEYKVMGLAPYSTEYYSNGPYDVYSNTLRVDDCSVAFSERPRDCYFYFKDKLEAFRFDGIAGGIQRYTEDLLCAWISNWMKHTGIKDIAFSGGVSMNIKANQQILERCKPDSFLVPGSGSDESLAIGACYHLGSHLNENIAPLPHMYLGSGVSCTDEHKLWEKLSRDLRYNVIQKAGNHLVAEHLADGKIIGRCVDNMEFGARALGNRSILADPRRAETIDIINKKIKSRDFWMPFAPSVMAEYANDYFYLKRGADYSSMAIGANTTNKGKRDLIASLHPADNSARPHIVSKDINPRYHDLLSCFRDITGVAGLLNTSFNKHGFPIIRTGMDALHVLNDTDIDGILVGSTLILKAHREKRSR